MTAYRWLNEVAVCVLIATLLSVSACGSGTPVSGAVAVIPTPGLPTTPPVISLAVASNWPTFAHDMARTGMQTLPTGIGISNANQLALNWTFKDGVGFLASPIVYNGTVYVVDHDGQLTALDASSGKIKWQQQLGLWVEQTPAIYDNILFVGNHDIPSFLYALDPQTGSILWRDTVPGGLKGSPVAIHGTLYEGIALGDPGFCSPGGVYSFNETTGAPTLTWLTELAGTSDGGAVWSPLTYDGSQIYFGTGNTCQNSPDTANGIIALNPASMSMNWRDQTASPLLDDDVGSGVFVNQGIGYAVGKNGFLYAMNLANGQILWARALGVPDGFGGVTIPTVVKSTLIVSAGYSSYAQNAASLDGFTPDGKLIWTMHAASEFRGVISNGDVAFTEIDNSVAAFDPQSGSILWSHATQGGFAGSPALAGGALYAADLSGTLYAFAPRNELSSSSLARRTRVSLPSVQRGSTRFVERRPTYCAINQ